MAYTDRVLESMIGVEIFAPAIWKLEVVNALLVGERDEPLRKAAGELGIGIFAS
jgi:hypothetical protein